MVDEYRGIIYKIENLIEFRFLYGRWIRWLSRRPNINAGGFRFLYGRWIRNINLPESTLKTRSDSSMVDEYKGKPITSLDELSSDSSMVDEYSWLSLLSINPRLVQIPLWSMNTREVAQRYWRLKHVQIPLWSMNTRHPEGSIYSAG